MKILVLSLTRPGHALDVVAKWLSAQGHRVTQVKLPSKHSHQFLLTPPKGNYDITITSEMTTALGLMFIPKQTSLGKKIFWRLDYRPKTYLGLYGVVDRFISKRFDEIWAMVPLNSKEKYVPYLLSDTDFLYSTSREDKVVWSGPDLDEILPRISPYIPNLVTTNWRGPQHLSDGALKDLWRGSKVGLALYSLSSRWSKAYSDPARIKNYLAAGLPVVSTDVSPFCSRLPRTGAGLLTNLSIEDIVAKVSECLGAFEEMSLRAYALAEEYRISERWVQL
jgi:hypothetical protein